jgi:hypothetical protein
MESSHQAIYSLKYKSRHFNFDSIPVNSSVFRKQSIEHMFTLYFTSQHYDLAEIISLTE